MKKRTMEWKKLAWGEVGPRPWTGLIPSRVYRSVCRQYQCEEHGGVWLALMKVNGPTIRKCGWKILLHDGADFASARKRCEQALVEGIEQ